MQTSLSDKYRDTAAGREADEILRACVHCGFCTATCPTYQLLGDELDGPRGRIYLIKEMLEGNDVTEKTQLHLDRCLTCRSCETTCPSGVRYGRLVDIGRELAEQDVPRGALDKAQRWLLRQVLPYPARFAPLVRMGQWLRPLLPTAVKVKVPSRQTAPPRPQQNHARRMLALSGCAQRVATPATNVATARVLDRLGIQLLEPEAAGCCGAVSHHLAAGEEALQFMRHNIDVWWPFVESGIEAIIVTASGCGVMVKDYGELLKHDENYADKARRVSELAKDISEIIDGETLSIDRNKTTGLRLAFQSPCTLQHGQQLNGRVESILTGAGFELLPVSDPHLCCGSAGTYSILQPVLSQQLLDNKLSALQQHRPDIIVTANIGCQLHLASKARAPVKHWIEVLDQAMGQA
jgi:glycolate oxidase iron-sulfur subunit